MVLRNFCKKYENIIIAAGLIIVLGILAAVRYDYYYDLNDDVVMKDILAGVYTGDPESMNIQMMYPMSLLISLFYRIFPQAPVYGIFLCACQLIGFFLIAERSVGFREHTASKLLMAGLEGLIIIVLFLPHFIFIQYTVTSALLAGTAAFLFITSDNEAAGRKFIRKNLLSIVLVIVAFGIRSEMLLLALPFICAAGIYRWSMESSVFTRENIVKYLGVIGSILAGIVLIYAMNDAVYSRGNWKNFIDFFNSRTELYDFQGIPPYEGNEELYERLGITQVEQNLLIEEYDFGMDDTLDAGILDAMAKYQAEKKKQTESITETCVEKLKEYKYRTLHREPKGSEKPDDYPWNIMVILGYISVFIAGIWNEAFRIKNSEAEYDGQVFNAIWKIGWKLVLMGFIRSVLWMYILMGGRSPERVTHSLYFIELCILWAMLHTESAAIEMKICGKVKVAAVFPAVLAITAAASISSSIAEVDREYAKRAEANTTDMQMKEYCRAHKENFYFFDVYSSVSDPVTSIPYSEKMFKNVNNNIANYEIMGGWLTKSPLYDKKLKAFGMSSMQEELIYGDNVYMMAELKKGTDFLTDYYEEQGMPAEAKLVDTINGIIGVYKIQENKIETIAD
ncbi:MAG: hypothetical protein GX235_13285 [Clostridiales bacterium]|nr:hypothetical protein [Clostridiales bacterium]